MKEIILTKGFIALVDDEDYEKCLHPRWFTKTSDKSPYACRSRQINKKKCHEKMHRFVLGITDPNITVDHVDGNTLNNQKSNLRICSRSQNSANVNKRQKQFTSKYKGVSWSKDRNLWDARICVNKSIKWLGNFTREELAARAYNEAALKYFGEFAKLNDI